MPSNNKKKKKGKSKSGKKEINDDNEVPSPPQGASSSPLVFQETSGDPNAASALGIIRGEGEGNDSADRVDLVADVNDDCSKTKATQNEDADVDGVDEVPFDPAPDIIASDDALNEISAHTSCNEDLVDLETEVEVKKGRGGEEDKVGGAEEEQTVEE